MIQTSDVPGIPVPEIPESGSGWLKALQGLSFDDAISNMANGLVSFSFKLLIAILVFYVGKYIIRKIYKVFYTDNHRNRDSWIGNKLIPRPVCFRRCGNRYGSERDFAEFCWRCAYIAP